MKRLLGLSALPLVGAVALLSIWVNRPIEPGATVANFQRLHQGMTLEQVEALLGPNDKSLQSTIPWMLMVATMKGTRGLQALGWIYKGCTITIWFSSTHKGRLVAECGFLATDDTETIFLRERPNTFIEFVHEFIGL